jgi:translation initiation factor 3 subunit H
MSWVKAAAEPEAPVALASVRLDGAAILKIIKHCNENHPALVTGQLLGLDVGSTLEVTACIPFPSRSSDEAPEEEGDGDASANYQLEMMRSLREVGADNNTVGWRAPAAPLRRLAPLTRRPGTSPPTWARTRARRL